MPATAPAIRHKLTGICPPARGAVIDHLTRAHPAPVWIVAAADLRAAEELAEDTSFFHEAGGGSVPRETLVFPESMPDARDLREAVAASNDRLTVLSRLRATRSTSSQVSALSSQLFILTTPAALLQPVPAIEEFASREFTLARGQKQSFHGLLERLQQLDYDSEAVCEAPGHYAIRGGIVDIYPVTASEPFRLDFFGDEIEEIRAFDPVTQRSGASVESISIAASSRVKLDPSRTGIADYVTPHAHLVFVEPAALEATFAPAALAPLLEKCAAAFALSDLDEASVLFDGAADDVTWDTESLASHRSYPEDALVARERLQVEEEARARFLHQVATWKSEGFAIAFVVTKDGEEQRIREILDENPQRAPIAPRFLRGNLNEGFRITFRDGAGIDVARAFQPMISPQNDTGSKARATPEFRGLVVVT
ncbi:MAG TPA: transcription-repair coupling factor, partial [Opitutus sp.]|nr:transcription-repair coupling factor [Opitutus sp.]